MWADSVYEAMLGWSGKKDSATDFSEAQLKSVLYGFPGMVEKDT